MYRINFLDEEQLYHTFCMKGSETHLCRLDKDLGHDEGCAGYGQTASSVVTSSVVILKYEYEFWYSSRRPLLKIVRGELPEAGTPDNA